MNIVNRGNPDLKFLVDQMNPQTLLPTLLTYEHANVRQGLLLVAPTIHEVPNTHDNYYRQIA